MKPVYIRRNGISITADAVLSAGSKKAFLKSLIDEPFTTGLTLKQKIELINSIWEEAKRDSSRSGRSIEADEDGAISTGSYSGDGGRDNIAEPGTTSEG